MIHVFFIVDFSDVLLLKYYFFKNLTVEDDSVNLWRAICGLLCFFVLLCDLISSSQNLNIQTVVKHVIMWFKETVILLNSLWGKHWNKNL